MEDLIEYPGYALVEIAANGSEWLRKDFGPNPILYDKLDGPHGARSARRELLRSFPGKKIEIRQVRLTITQLKTITDEQAERPSNH